MNSVLSGVYIIDKKENDIYLKSTLTQQVTRIDYFKFSNLLLQKFDYDRIKKILEHLCNYKRLLIDFDTETIKLIETKEQSFMTSYNKYFTKEAAEAWFNGNEWFFEDIDTNF